MMACLNPLLSFLRVLLVFFVVIMEKWNKSGSIYPGRGYLVMETLLERCVQRKGAIVRRISLLTSLCRMAFRNVKLYQTLEGTLADGTEFLRGIGAHSAIQVCTIDIFRLISPSFIKSDFLLIF